MSNSSRINKATNELDKAEKRLLYSLDLTEVIQIKQIQISNLQI